MKIIKVKKNEDGEVTDVMLENEKIVSFSETVDMIKNKEIEGVTVAHRGDKSYLRSVPNQDDGDNINNLPTF
jgi:hypothetical protein